MTSLRLLFVCGAITLISTSVIAEQDSRATGQANIQEQVLVTGVYSPLSVDLLSSSTTTMDFQAISKLNKSQLADVLNAVPGVLVEQQGGPGGISAASIRGGESNYTVVMVDGVTVNDPSNSRGGSFDLGNINVNEIERIEVVRGPQSAVYGADALAGVINIITREAKEGFTQSVFATTGSEGYESFGFSALGANENVSYAVQVQQHDAGEPIEGSTANNDNVNLKLQWKNTQHKVSAIYRYFEGERTTFPEQSGGPLFAAQAALDTADYDDTIAALRWEYIISDFWTSQVSANQYQRNEIYDSPGILPYFSVPPNGAETDYERSQIQWVNTLGNKGRLWANIGAEQREEDGVSEGYLNIGALVPTNFELTREITSAFVDVNSQVNNSLLLQASVRQDDTEGFESQTTWNLGLRWSLPKDISLRATVGEGFKLPSFIALGHPLVGNPNLKPERAESWDLALDWQFSKNFFATLAYFENQFIDPIDFDGDAFMNVNRDRIDTSGVEWQSQWQSDNAQVQFRTYATYTDIDVINSDTVLNGRPDWRAGAQTSWQFNEVWRASVDYQWVGEQFSGSLHTGDSVVQKLGHYDRVDTSMFWQIGKDVAVNLALENVFGEQYQTTVGFPAPSRLWRLGLSWTI